LRLLQHYTITIGQKNEDNNNRKRTISSTEYIH